MNCNNVKNNNNWHKLDMKWSVCTANKSNCSDEKKINKILVKIKNKWENHI